MTGFTLPTSRPITQPWGMEFYDFDGDGINEYPNGFYRTVAGWFGHNGIDYGCFTGDSVEAVADGVVEFAGWGDNDSLMTYGGNAIRIRHDAYKVRSGYLHLSEVLVSAGQTVKKGQVIAKSGATGTVTAPHLHLEMYRIGAVDQGDGWRGRIDPTPYLYGELNPDYATNKKEWWEMPIATAELIQIANAVNNKAFRADIATETADKVLATPILSTDGKKWPLSAHVQGNTARTVEALARLAALEELVQQFAKGQGTVIDMEAVSAAAEAGAQRALSGLSATVTIKQEVTP